MWDAIQAHEPIVRLSAFFGIFAIMALWELAAPRRVQRYKRRVRWPANIGIVVLNTVVLRLIFPAAAMGVALSAQAQGWGLLSILALPDWLALIAAFVILDFAIYLQHVLVHAVPALWRLHRMHHADQDFDVTTGARFHPLEIIISMGLKLMVVGAIGAPPFAVLIFEVVLNASAMFNHANVRLPLAIDRILRRILVTPDMHRVHHSVIAAETHSNFGFCLSWWDYLFGTYRAQPKEGHEAMTIGLPQFRDACDLRLDQLLIQPLRGRAPEAGLKD